MRKVFTLAMVVKNNKLLLGKKQAKLGAGLWNGFGGKVEPGETVEEAAMRECKEEAGIQPLKVEKFGTLVFHHPTPLLGFREHEVHVFAVNEYIGELLESNEMRELTWFSMDEIPYDLMWDDDRHWLPLLLAGKRFSGAFWFDDKQELIDWKVRGSIAV